MYVNKFYKVLNVNNDALIVMCVALEGLLADYKGKGGLATKPSLLSSLLYIVIYRRLDRRLGLATWRP